MAYQKKAEFRTVINGVNFHVYTRDDGIYIDKLENGYGICLAAVDYSDPQYLGQAIISAYANLDDWRPTYEGIVENVCFSEQQRAKFKKEVG